MNKYMHLKDNTKLLYHGLFVCVCVYLLYLGGWASVFLRNVPASPRSDGAVLTHSSTLRSMESWMVTLHTDTHDGCSSV